MEETNSRKSKTDNRGSYPEAVEKHGGNSMAATLSIEDVVGSLSAKVARQEIVVALLTNASLLMRQYADLAQWERVESALLAIRRDFEAKAQSDQPDERGSAVDSESHHGRDV